MSPMIPMSVPVRRPLSETGTDLASLHASRRETYPFLLQSVASGTPQGRWDILFAFPGERRELDAAGRLHGGAGNNTDFLRDLDHWFGREGTPGRTCPEGLPFCGGWFLYLGYELAGQVEPKLRLPEVEEPLPTALAVRIPAAILRDHDEGRLWWVAESAEADAEFWPRARGDLRLPPEDSDAELTDLTEDDGAFYHAAVEQARRYIRDGDIFQANLARCWRGRLEPGSDPVALYRQLATHNPAPFAGLADLGAATVISSSPERLLSVRRGRAAMRPIAGTRPRGEGAGDRALSDELMRHPKERAEHVMLIDLIRNDLGRVCRPGSVAVDEQMVLESYAHVHHIVSNVVGELRPGIGPGEAIRAAFPGGTITGCPKVRCMAIIAELEQQGRGAYTGSMGYLDGGGDLDLNILIRTLVQSGDRLTLRAGAGIVVDSDPEAELAETRAKARGLLAALEAVRR
ncbi:MAG: aminodeoxychorismate synthase component I [Pseudomonadota bacterium]